MPDIGKKVSEIEAARYNNCVCAHMCVHVCVYVCLCVCVCACVSVYVCVCTHAHAHVCVCVHACMHVCVWGGGVWWVLSLFEVGLLLQTGDDVIKCGLVVGGGGPAGLGQGREVGWPLATDGGTLTNVGQGSQDVAGGIVIRYLALHHLPHDEEEGEDVALLVDGLVLSYHRGHPVRGAMEVRTVALNNCDAPKSQIWATILSEENIAGLKIVVDIIKTVHE